MKVRELVDRLQQVEDQDLPVVYEDPDWICTVMEIDGVVVTETSDGKKVVALQ